MYYKEISCPSIDFTNPLTSADPKLFGLASEGLRYFLRIVYNFHEWPLTIEFTNFNFMVDYIIQVLIQDFVFYERACTSEILEI